MTPTAVPARKPMLDWRTITPATVPAMIAAARMKPPAWLYRPLSMAPPLADAASPRHDFRALTLKIGGVGKGGGGKHFGGGERGKNAPPKTLFPAGGPGPRPPAPRPAR